MRIRGHLACLALCAAVLSPISSSAGSPGVLVAAHRGGSLLAPENTLAAFRSAQALFDAHPGVDGWIEMDARLSMDEVPIVIHDDTLDRTTDCTGPVSGKYFVELMQCNAAQDWPSWGFQNIPMLGQVFREAAAANPPWKIMLEIKDIPIDNHYDATERIAVWIAALVRETGLPYENLIVQSFWPLHLDAISVLDPRITTMLLTTSTLPGAPDGVGFTLTQNAAYSTVRNYAISSPDQETADLDADGVALAHSLGRRVITWTVNTAADRDRVLAAGVDGVITDDPTLMLED